MTTDLTTWFSQPKFLSKEERAKIAIAKRAQEIKQEKERTDASRRDRETLEKEAEEVGRRERTSYSGGGGGGRCQCS